MKNLLLASACTLCFTLAHAQSSVTLYGTLDVGVDAVSNESGHRTVLMSTGILIPNLFGLKGTEDLGGGTRAIFQLESQYEVGTGETDGPALFGRQAWLGITNDRFGTLTLGNQYDYMASSLTLARMGPLLQFLSVSDMHHGPFDALGKPGPYGGSFDFDGTSGSSRMSNSIKYQSPVFDGLTAGAMYGFSNVAGAFSTGNSYSMGIDYTQPTFTLNAAYRMIRYPTINNGANGIENFGLGGRVAVMKGWFDFMYTNTRNTFTGATINLGEVGATIPIRDTIHVRTSYQYMKGNAVLENNQAHQVGLILVDSLSRRTDVYASVTYQHASGDGNTAQAWIQSLEAPSSTGNQTVFRIGMRQFF